MTNPLMTFIEEFERQLAMDAPTLDAVRYAKAAVLHQEELDVLNDDQALESAMSDRKYGSGE